MHGFLLIDKPAGMTSHDVVDRLRKITGVRKIGHAGTLDPFATGLLFLGIGSYTKKLQSYVGLDKTYVAGAVLGQTSDTYDTEGKIQKSEVKSVPSAEEVDQVLAKFTGEYEQLAPLYSAKKVGGQTLYKLARKGLADESLRPSKRVRIFELELLEYEWPRLEFRVRCGSGTYIRSLVHDIGQALGVGAYAATLRRLSIGEFSVDRALSLDGLDKNTVERALFLDSESAG